MMINLARKTIEAEILCRNWGVVTVGQRGDEKSLCGARQRDRQEYLVGIDYSPTESPVAGRIVALGAVTMKLPFVLIHRQQEGCVTSTHRRA